MMNIWNTYNWTSWILYYLFNKRVVNSHSCKNNGWNRKWEVFEFLHVRTYINMHILYTTYVHTDENGWNAQFEKQLYKGIKAVCSMFASSLGTQFNHSWLSRMQYKLHRVQRPTYALAVHMSADSNLNF